MKKLNKRVQLILTKDFLIKKYIKNKKSIYWIANEINCGNTTIWRYLKKFNILRRSIGNTQKGKNNHFYIDGRCSKKHYCIDCLKQGIKTEISLHSALGGNGRCKSCARKDKNNPMFGKKRPKISKRMQGKNHPNFGNFGKNSFGYIDGRIPLRSAIRRLGEYSSWRTLVFKRDSYTCQKCFKRGCKLGAHHIKTFSIILFEFLKKYDQFSPIEDKETLIRFAIKYKPFWDVSNGQTLCKDCHKTIKKKSITNG